MPFPKAGDHLPTRGNALMRAIGRASLRLMRFRFRGPLPTASKFVIIGAPHTSNWDFVLGMSLLFALGIRINWIGKHTIFKPPFGVFMRWMGGLPVNRHEPGSIVDQVVAEMARHERFIVGLSPEGTRKAVDRWKTGFYRIAVGAGVPIAIGVIDFGNRELRIEGLFEPTGDLEADMAAIRSRYDGVLGKYPDQFT